MEQNKINLQDIMDELTYIRSGLITTMIASESNKGELISNAIYGAVKHIERIESDLETIINEELQG